MECHSLALGCAQTQARNRNAESKAGGSPNLNASVAQTHVCAHLRSRPRYYIIGLRKDRLIHRFNWPASVPTPPLDDFLDRNVRRADVQMPSGRRAQENLLQALAKIKAQGGMPSKDPFVVEVGSGRGPHIMLGVVPCLTRTRCGQGGHFLCHKNRLATQSEMLRLQGIAPERLVQPSTVTTRQMNMALGNTSTVAVIEKLLARMLTCIGMFGDRAS